MQPRSDGAPFEREAVVDPDQCMSCGLCVGACPTATPFRRAATLKAGIELPQLPLDGLRERIETMGSATGTDDRVLVFRCQHSKGIPTLPEGASVLELPCIGMLPPSFIDLTISRRFAAGVMLAGCDEGACYQRLGIRWTQERIGRERDPQLRERVPRDRIGLSWAGSKTGAHAKAIVEFQQHLRRLGRSIVWRHASAAAALVVCNASRLAEPALRHRRCSAGDYRRPDRVPVRPAGSDAAESRRGGNHAQFLPRRDNTARNARCRQPQILPSCSQICAGQSKCPRARWPIVFELELNGQALIENTLPPAGLWSDGPASIYRRLTVPSGEQTVTVRLRDTGRTDGFDYESSRQVKLRPNQNVVIDFDADSGFLFR